MAYALRIAGRGTGNTAENPAVGCLLVDQQNNLVATGFTAPGGRPHAERRALDMAGDKARGTTAYVTLEPCSHHGQSPPCADALVKAGVKRVVIAATDPDPRVSGRGIEALEAAGIDVTTGVLAERAEHQLRGFFSRQRRHRPHVILKLAVSQDEKIAAAAGQQTAITGPEFKSQVHLLRARADAILVGAGTVRTDAPSLTCRLPGLTDRSPLPVIIGCDKNLTLPPGSLHFPGHADLSQLLADLADRGINTLLVEGGARVAESFVAGDLVDEAIIATAPLMIGEQGVQALNSLSLSQIAANARFVLKQQETFGPDVVRTYLRKRGK